MKEQYNNSDRNSTHSRCISQSPLIEQSATVMAALLDKSSYILDKRFGQHYAAINPNLVVEVLKVGIQEYIEAARSIEWASHVESLCKAIERRQQ